MNLLEAGNTDQTIVDENKDYLAELVGEGKKFKDEKELAKGKYLADMYIKDLERGRDELRTDYLKQREELMSRAKLEELVDQISKKTLTSSDTPLNAKEVQEQPKIDPKEVEDLVAAKIHKMELARKQEENSKLVKDKLQERYGQNYTATVRQQIDELGISEAQFNDMAINAPRVLIRTLGLDQQPAQERFQSPPGSQQRSDSFAPSVPNRTWSWYEKLRKEDPKRYWDNKTQVQMHRDHAASGTKFEDGNFKALF